MGCMNSKEGCSSPPPKKVSNEMHEQRNEPPGIPTTTTPAISLSEKLKFNGSKQCTHRSSLQGHSTPPLEPLDGQPEQQNQPRNISSTTTSVDTDLLRDIYLWRRKCLSFTIFLVATIIWVLVEVYKYNFITVVSWIEMFFFTSMFFFGNMRRLLKKETPNLSRMGMTELLAMKIANTIRQVIERGGSWVFRVGAEGGWFEFTGVVAALSLTSFFAEYLDFPTFLYIGVVIGLSLPIICVKYQNKIKQFGQCLRSLRHMIRVDRRQVEENQTESS